MGCVQARKLMLNELSLPTPLWRDCMLYTIVAILVILWLLGMLTSVGGGLIHILLVIAVIVIVVRLISGRKIL